MENEIWKPVPGLDGYEISSLGRVKSIERVVLRKNGTLCSVTGKYRSVHMSNSGYRMVTLYRGGVRVVNTIAYFMCVAFIGPKPTPEHQVNHKDGIKTNDFPDNLEWVTPSENILHAYNKGLADKQHAISDEEILQMKKLRDMGLTWEEMGQEMNVNWRYLEKIFSGKRHRVKLRKMNLTIGKDKKGHKVLVYIND